jgi:ABC-type transport system involved in cytochrome bd biosynthesis fused ATPase/permease subunit
MLFIVMPSLLLFHLPLLCWVLLQIFHAVGLDQDLAAMPAGDLTQVGEDGAGLSGGQRLRVALARALYQPGVSLYLFDDILASLDGHVAQVTD